MGGVWQDADINLEHPGFGYGLTFGRAIYEKPGSFWGLDLRFRYLRGHSYGIDPERFLLDSTFSDDFGAYADSVGYTYLNNKTDIHDYSLEAVLKFHRLREQTGILFHIFGGIGITDYQTKMNLLDENDAIYDYSSFQPQADEVALASILDDSYESNAPKNGSRRIEFMPSLGVGIGYQITPVISIGAEHRTTFTLHDDFEGIQGEGSEWLNLKSGNDVYHYTSLFLRWNIMKGKDVTDETYQPECDKPYVAIDAPVEGQTFVNTSTSFSARVTRINGNNDIILKVNGRAVSTQYSHSTELVTATIPLTRGKNIVELTAVNSCGRTVEIRNIIYQTNECFDPIVTITSPIGGSVTNQSQIIRASVSQLDGGNVSVTLNGRAINPAFNSSTGMLSANVTLTEGNNLIEVRATNDCGSDTKTLTLIYTTAPPCLSPGVNIFTPANGSQTSTNSVNISAYIANITSGNEATCLVNGVAVASSYNSTNQTLTANATLREGTNTITITGRNNCGQDTKTVTVNYIRPCDQPQVSITTPFYNQNFSSPVINFRANVLNIANIANVSLSLNGSNAAFNLSGNQVVAGLSLRKGVNTITIRASNNCGNVEETVQVTYDAPCPQPSVSIMEPITGRTYTTKSVNLSAVAWNISSTNQVAVKLNGNLIPSTYNNVTKKIAANLNLVEGNNVVTVQVINECGDDDKTINIVYSCPTPKINFIDNTKYAKYTSAKVTVVAQVVNVNNRNDVQVTLNGSVIPSTFNNVTGQLTISTNLIEGKNTIRVVATSACGKDEQNLVINYAAPCDPPVISMRVEGEVQTSSELFNVGGTVSNLNSKNELQVIVNGTPQPFNYNAGSFNAQVKVKPGKNTVEIKATTSCGSISKVVTVTYNAPCNAPIVTLKEPTATTVSNAKTNLTANVSNINTAQEVSVYLNNVVQTGITYFNGKVSGTLTLREGKNVIRVVATNSCGTDQKQVIITYEKQCDLPVINTRTKDGAQSSSESFNISGTVTNITNAGQLQIKLNGVSQQVNYSNGTFSAQVKLNGGKNTIEIIAKNNCGTDSKTIEVVYNVPCTLPKVTITSPTQTTTKSSSVKLLASVTGIKSASEVAIYLNNNIERNISYTNGFVSGMLNLRDGKNVIRVVATNSCGMDQKQVIITYSKPCDVPVINTRLKDGAQSSSETFNISGTVSNITSANDITITVNNKIAIVNYSGGTFNAQVKLQAGTNTLVITAKTSCGVDAKSLTVTYDKPCPKPALSVRAPQTGMQTSQETLNISGTATNISSANDLSIMINSKLVIVNYSGGTFNAKAKLNSGKNTIVITVKTACGVDTKTAYVTYNKPCPKPSATVTAPSSSTTHKTKQLSFRANVSEVSSSNDIKVKLNGKIILFKYDGRSTITGTLTGMKNGNNTLYVEVSNDCGNKLFTHTFKYEVVKPTIVISSPTNGSKSEAKQVKVTGYVKDVDNDNQITFKMNNKLIKVRVLRQKDGSYKYDQYVPVDVGSNKLYIEARNNYGYSASKSVTFERTVQVIKSTETKGTTNSDSGGTEGSKTVTPNRNTRGGSTGSGSIRPRR